MFIVFRKSKPAGGGMRAGWEETSIWETLISCFLYMLQLGTEPEIWICALTRNWTYNLVVYGTTLQATELPSQGETDFKNMNIGIISKNQDLIGYYLYLVLLFLSFWLLHNEG